MPRRPNDRPTTIYWLLDCRPAVLAQGWVRGLPFYCGKTVYPPSERLKQHRYSAMQHPNRLSARRMLLVGEHVQMHVVEVVPLGSDWAARERHWIQLIRFSFPGVVNINDGGDGAPGNIHSDIAKLKMRFGNLGKKRSKRTRERIAAARRRAGRERRKRLGILEPQFPPIKTRRMIMREMHLKRMERLAARKAKFNEIKC